LLPLSRFWERGPGGEGRAHNPPLIENDCLHREESAECSKNLAATSLEALSKWVYTS
jgi:hypothetical protein